MSRLDCMQSRSSVLCTRIPEEGVLKLPNPVLLSDGHAKTLIRLPAMLQSWKVRHRAASRTWVPLSSSDVSACGRVRSIKSALLLYFSWMRVGQLWTASTCHRVGTRLFQLPTEMPLNLKPHRKYLTSCSVYHLLGCQPEICEVQSNREAKQLES